MAMHYEKYTCENCTRSVTVLANPDAEKSNAPAQCWHCNGTRFLVTDAADENLIEKIRQAVVADPRPAGKLAEEIGIPHFDLLPMLFDLRRNGKVTRDDCGNWRWLAPLDVAPEAVG